MDLSTLGAEDRVAVAKDAVLRRGDKGAEVLELQQLLVNAGYQLKPDGDFGPTTEKFVRAVQTKNNLVADGIAGPKTIKILRGCCPVSLKLLSQADLVWAAGALRTDVASVMCVNAVESRGHGFFDDGRPVILFERHIMYRMLDEHDIKPAPFMANQPGLVNTKSGGYIGGSREYDRLEKAKLINKAAALESASWGAYQIMGFHWELLGFASVDAFVASMYVSERMQLEAFVKFIQSQRGLLKAIQTQDWVNFARLYNGAGYAKNQYDTKLAAEYTRAKKLLA
jgi:hypothetical protein